MPYKNKTDKNAHDKRYHDDHKAEYQARQLKKIAEFNLKWKNGLLCQICGSDGSDVPHGINYHHTVPEEKTFNINWADCRSKTDVEINAEITKCVPLCNVCHSRITHDKGMGSHTDNKAYLARKRTDPHFKEKQKQADARYKEKHRNEILARNRARYNPIKRHERFLREGK